jgi:hypothetical protein
MRAIRATSAHRDTRSASLPAELWWTQRHGPRPLPLCAIRQKGNDERPLPALYTGGGYHATEFMHGPFDLTDHLRRLCTDIVARCDFFHHIDAERILFHLTRSRGGQKSGLLAKVTPMRFRHGQVFRKRRGYLCQVQRYFVNDVEMLYLMAFCVPRFLNLSFEQKMITVFHELWHIAPEFNGDLRRHMGRCYVHTHSKKSYDEQMAQLARHYLNHGAPPAELHAFLRLNFTQLQQRYGSVVGQFVPAPRLVRIVE